MKIEVLIATMNQKDLSLVAKMNIKTDAIIVNQCDKVGNFEKKINGNNIVMRSYKERGLSKSRNRAISSSRADICVIADDDLVYKDNYEYTISKNYKKYPDADVIAFDVPSTNSSRPTSSLKEGNVDFLHSMKISSFQITFRRKSLADNGLTFNEFFGAGSKYNCGEENILLTECLRKGLKIIYVPKEIATVHHNESTWYSGFNRQLFEAKGAMFYEMSPVLSYLLILQFALRKWKLYKQDIRIISAFKFMLEGLSEYKLTKKLKY